jgi:hypothetical protein
MGLGGFYGWTVDKDLSLIYLSLKCNSSICLERRKKINGILADFCTCNLEQVKKGRPCERRRDKFEEDLNVMEINMTGTNVL